MKVMSNVVDIDSVKPHKTKDVECKLCNHNWVAVYPVNTIKLECPKCLKFVNEFGTPVSTHICKTCKREFTVCPPTDFEYCLAEDCNSYDPSRDADRYFDLWEKD